MLAGCLICVAAVVDVTLLGGTGAPTRGPRDCLTIQELRTSCDRSDAWYRPTKQKPDVRRLLEGPTPQRRASGDERAARGSGKRCLELVHPIKVDLSR